ncbi:Mitotic spindle assembly checkpoint protein MAD2A [Armadillidium vulgare]|nr:Mitotic spindle assembly checkpoint protein MAD2A [Armadillidium vulgare]
MPDTQEQSNCVTLKGSGQLVSEFFFYGINSILYQRGIYPPESFTYKQQYGLTVFLTTDDGVKKYLNTVLAQIKDWLEAGQISRLVLVISNADNKETLERWDFRIQHEKGFEAGQKDRNTKSAEKDLKEIQKEMREVMRQITACVTFLPLLDCTCSFDLLVYTHKNLDVPDEWGDSAACYIADAESVRLKSFSTSVHKVDTCVSYKLNL